MKTYILEPSETELKNLTEKVGRKILSSLRDAYPDGLTTKELVEKTGEAESTVYSSRGRLEKENYIKQITDKKNRPGRPGPRAIDTRSTRYLIEDANYLNYSKDRYKLSRGNVEYPTEFIRMSNKLFSEIDLESLFDNLLMIVKQIHSRISQIDDKEFEAWAPAGGKENLCPNCRINHEVRDFVRALLLRLVDRFETHERYVNFLNENEYVSLTEEYVSPILPEELPSTKLKPKSGQMAMGSVILRVLSIEKQTDQDQFYFLAINKDGKYLCGIMDPDLLTDNMIPNCMIECLTNDIHDSEVGFYIGLSRQANDTIRVIPDNRTFPKIRDLITNIESIIMGQGTRDDTYIVDYIVEGIVIEDPKIENIDDGITKVLIRDITGILPLELDNRYLNKFHKGDKILAVGAHQYGWHELTAGTYGSVTKTGEVIITDRNSPFVNPVYSKHLNINSRLLRNMVTVSLVSVELTAHDTRVFLRVQNDSKEDLNIYSTDCIAIREKRQFTKQYDPLYKTINLSIPSGIIESGIIRFEALDPTKPIATFRFRIHIGFEKLDFTFTVQIPH